MEGYALDPNMLVNALTKDNDAVGGNGLLWIFLLILFQVYSRHLWALSCSPRCVFCTSKTMFSGL